MIGTDQLLGAYDAVMFDLDGTLIDTMPVHYAAYARVLAAYGWHLTMNDYMKLVGPPAGEVIGRFVAAAGGDPARIDPRQIHADKKVAFEALLAERCPPLLPAAAVLAAAQGRVRCALVSSGNRRGVEAILAACGWTDRFEAVVTGDDVTRGKPDPEPYRRAAAMLGVVAGRCAALEDTPAGMASARAAGMHAFDVADLAVVA